MEFSPDAKRAFHVQAYGVASTIDGVRVVELARHADDGGAMTELARLADGRAAGLGDFTVRQVNFSELAPGAIKAFHLHARQTDVWFVPPSDRMLVVLLDVRKGSRSENVRQRVVLGHGASRLLVIPPGVARGVDAVVNFAACTHVDRSLVEPDEFLRTDVSGVFTLLEAVRDLKIPRLLHVSTDEVYGSIAHGSSTEQDPLHPSNPYSASKAGGDLLALAYWHTHGVPVVITRSSNNFGPYQYPEKVVPLFVTNALDDAPLPLYGDGRNVRDWLYVLDNCAAIDLVLRQGRDGEIYNIGGGHEVENIVLTREILRLTARPDTLIRPVADRPGHDRRYSVDSTKIRQLGWAPRHPFASALETTVRWYREHEPWWRPLKSGEFRAWYERQYGNR